MLIVLGFFRDSVASVKPVGTTGPTGLAHGFIGVDSFDDRSCVLAHPSVFGAILCQHDGSSSTCAHAYQFCVEPMFSNKIFGCGDFDVVSIFSRVV